MKDILVIIILFATPFYSFCQIKTALPNKDLKNAVTKEAFARNRSDVTLKIDKDFELSGSVKFDSAIIDNHFFVVSAKVGSTNEYNPLLNNGKWALDLGLDFSTNFYLNTRKWYFKKDIDAQIEADGNKENAKNRAVRQAAMRKLEKLNKMSQFETMWVTFALEGDYKSYFVLNDSISTSMDLDDMYSKNGTPNLLITARYNALRTLSFKHGRQISGNIGYTFGVNTSNYESLDKIQLFKSQITTDSMGQSIVKKTKEVSVREGELDFATSHTLKGEVHFTTSTVAENKPGVGIDIFAKPELNFWGANQFVFNMRAGINLSILPKKGKGEKSTKSIVNIGLVLDFRNICSPLKDTEEYFDRFFVPGLILGVPLPDIGKP